MWLFVWASKCLWNLGLFQSTTCHHYIARRLSPIFVLFEAFLVVHFVLLIRYIIGVVYICFIFTACSIFLVYLDVVMRAFEKIRDVLSWWCLAVLNYVVLYSFVPHLALVRNVNYLSILRWKKLTKCWTKVVIYGSFVRTNMTHKRITNRSPLRVHDCQIEYKLKPFQYSCYLLFKNCYLHIETISLETVIWINTYNFTLVFFTS